jgi:hypothetical protein
MYIDNLCQNQQPGEKAPFPQPFPYSVQYKLRNKSALTLNLRLATFNIKTCARKFLRRNHGQTKIKKHQGKDAKDDTSYSRIYICLSNRSGREKKHKRYLQLYTSVRERLRSLTKALQFDDVEEQGSVNTPSTPSCLNTAMAMATTIHQLTIWPASLHILFATSGETKETTHRRRHLSVCQKITHAKYW